MRSEDTKCPHADIRFCPLYHAAHECIGIGCDDGKLGQGGCAVDRGMDYHKELGKLNPKYVALVKWKEEAEQIRLQRARNMRSACVQ